MPPDGAEILVVLDPIVFTGTLRRATEQGRRRERPIRAVVRRVHGTWRAYEVESGMDDALSIDFAIHEEGVVWARGWDSDDAKALLAAQALL